MWTAPFPPKKYLWGNAVIHESSSISFVLFLLHLPLSLSFFILWNVRLVLVVRVPMPVHHDASGRSVERRRSETLRTPSSHGNSFSTIPSTRPSTSRRVRWKPDKGMVGLSWATYVGSSWVGLGWVDLGWLWSVTAPLSAFVWVGAGMFGSLAKGLSQGNATNENVLRRIVVEEPSFGPRK